MKGWVGSCVYADVDVDGICTRSCIVPGHGMAYSIQMCYAAFSIYNYSLLCG